MTKLSWPRLVLAGIGALASCFALVAHLSLVEADIGLEVGANSLGLALLVVPIGGLGIKALGQTAPRVQPWAAGLGALIGLLGALGLSISRTKSILGLAESPLAAVKLVGLALGLGWLVYALAALILGYVTRPAAAPMVMPRYLAGPRRWAGRWYRHRPKQFGLALWLGLCVSRLGYLAWLYPGVVTNDSAYQLRQALGIDPLTTHHPVAHTAMIYPFAKLGQAVGSLDVGVAAFSVTQIALTSAGLAYCLMRVLAWGVNRWVWFGLLAFYALFPLNGAMAVTMWKNVPFAVVMVVLITLLAELIQDPTRLGRAGFMAGFGGSLLGVALLRNDGIAAAAVALVAAWAVSRGVRGRATGLALAVLVVCGLIQGPGYTALGAARGSTVEALGIPLQAVAYTAKVDPASFDAKERAELGRWFGGLSVEQVGELYKAGLSDPVKDDIDLDWMRGHLEDFLQGWMAMAARHGGTFADATVTHTHGYWYPEFKGLTLRPMVVARDGLTGLTGRQSHHYNRTAVEMLFEARSVPVTGMIYSIGFGFDLALLAAAALAVRRKAKYALLLAPLVPVWLACMASPVWGEYRYAYGYLLSLPIVLVVALSRGWGDEP